MKNTLFITCPFSCLEVDLQKQFGKEIFFLSSTTAALQYEESEYLEGVKDFILRKKIKTIYFVNDTSCKFINGVIKKKANFGFYPEEVLKRIYTEYYASDFKRKALSRQQIKLAELNLNKQMKMIRRCSVLGTYIRESKIEIKGLITIKSKKKHAEFALSSVDINLYEL
jgi:hypothetical protein